MLVAIRDLKNHARYLGAMLALLVGVIGCRSETKEQPRTVAAALSEQTVFLNLDPKVEYVGDEDCALCHSEIFRSFKQTGMGRSF